MDVYGWCGQIPRSAEFNRRSAEMTAQPSADILLLWQQIFMINIFNCVLMEIRGKVCSIGRGGNGSTRPIFLNFTKRSYLNQGRLT